MLQRIDLRGHDGDLADVLPRPAPPSGGPVEVVHEILAAVEARGDAAVREFTERFDGVALDALVVPAEELTSAVERIAPEVRAALQLAADRVAAYHAAQVPADVIVEQPGMSIRGMHRAVQRAACYVPGGRAVYPSTVVMTVVPARVAGVEEIVVCVPPGPDGQVPDVVLAAASIAGAHEVVAVGGAQAIGAVAFGTESIRAVDVIVGPGNVFVALAKQAVAGRVGVPSSFAGPSEVVVIADGTDPIDFAAIDVILQAEHGPDGLAWFITWDADVADAVTAAIERLVADAPRRAEIESTLGASGVVVVTEDAEQAMAVSNFIAPEHLELQTADNDALIAMVRNAGAVFAGAHAPASLGDYAAGPSHVLPTNGTARFASALTVRDFMKDLHVVTVEPEGFELLGDAVEVLAGAEGLDAHAASIRLRRGAER